ncbi:MAG: hypothetical protein MUO19_03545 [Dehalococcoidales bacterium]|nr:hypothetical protein [Dehalococcoidales bacterium]
MTFQQELKAFTQTIPAELKEKIGVYELSFVVAERKAFLSKQKLEYKAKFRIDDGKRLVKFTELLKESGSGLSSGDSSPGFGFKKETYRTKGKEREGSIEEQSNLFGKKYEYRFDFKTVRKTIEELAQNAGYEFAYQVTPFGL